MEIGDKVWINGQYKLDWYTYLGETVSGHPILEDHWTKTQLIYKDSSKLMPMEEIDDSNHNQTA